MFLIPDTNGLLPLCRHLIFPFPGNASAFLVSPATVDPPPRVAFPSIFHCSRAHCQLWLVLGGGGGDENLLAIPQNWSGPASYLVMEENERTWAPWCGISQGVLSFALSLFNLLAPGGGGGGVSSIHQLRVETRRPLPTQCDFRGQGREKAKFGNSEVKAGEDLFVDFHSGRLAQGRKKILLFCSKADRTCLAFSGKQKQQQPRGGGMQEH